MLSRNAFHYSLTQWFPNFFHGSTVSGLKNFRNTPVVKSTVFPNINNAFYTIHTCYQIHFE